MNISLNKSNERAWTIFELLALIFVIYVPFLVGSVVAKKYGDLAGTGAGIFSALVCVSFVVLFYRHSKRQQEHQRIKLKETYRGIYRVVSIPSNQINVKKRQGDEIKIGDYGWEAEPLEGKNNLIHLQGLNENWEVVWYAGFSPEQIEFVSTKPRSQYDWNYSWVKNPPKCLYPVQPRKTVGMGLPNVWGWNGSRLK